LFKDTVNIDTYEGGTIEYFIVYILMPLLIKMYAGRSRSKNAT